MPTAEWVQQFNAAAALHVQGQHAEARSRYLKLVVEQPPNPALITLLGLLEKELGQPQLAAHWLELAFKLEAHFDNAMHLVDLQLQQPDKALARTWLATAEALKPDTLEADFKWGLACKQAGEPEKALAALERVLQREPQHAQAGVQRAHVLLGLGQAQAALDGFERYLQLRPDDTSVLYNRGMALHSLQRFADSAASFRQATQLDPNFHSAYCNLANALSRLGQHEAALAAHDDCLRLAPDDANYLYNKGVVLHELGRFDEAAATFSQALMLRPDFTEAAYNRGNALREALRLPEAIASFEIALARQPDNANFHWSKALAALLHGDYTSGWHHFERRWTRDGGETPRQFNVPQWTGKQSIAGKTLLIHGEQGLGDIFQFSRYALDVIALGGKVVFGMPPVVHGLLQSMHPAIKTIQSHAEHPDFDFYAPVMSLPYAFSTTLQSVPAPCPYFFADGPLKEAWQRTLGPRRKPRVGLVWYGNPKHLHDHRRSIPLDTLRPLLQLPIEFHCLQQTLRPQDAATLKDGPPVHFHGASLTDFEQTSALIANLDLVLSVDTAVAHLTGALGKPVWILIHAVPDYRWLLNRDDSPWYPSARLFRQSRRDSWSEAVQTLRQALAQHFGLA